MRSRGSVTGGRIGTLMRRIGLLLALLLVFDGGLMVLLAALKAVSLYVGAALVLLLSLAFYAAILTIMRVRRLRDVKRAEIMKVGR